MKKIILLIFTASIFFTQAQDTAIIKVVVQAEDLSPLNGEQIVFEAQSGNYTTKGISNAEGIFKVPLLGGETYNIKLKSIGEEDELNSIEIPALEPNTAYGEYLYTLTIFPPKNFTLNNVLFETASSKLKNESKKELDELFQYLSLKQEVKVQIIGHTDNVGNDEVNQKLSEERAKSVVNYLVSKGISKDRLSSIGYGSSQAVADNNTAEGRKLNRRTEVRVL